MRRYSQNMDRCKKRLCDILGRGDVSKEPQNIHHFRNLWFLTLQNYSGLLKTSLLVRGCTLNICAPFSNENLFSAALIHCYTLSRISKMDCYDTYLASNGNRVLSKPFECLI